MSRTRHAPHWVPEGWRLLWAGIPQYLTPNRRRVLAVVIGVSGVAGALGGWFLGSIDDASLFFALLGAIVLPAFAMQFATIAFRRGKRHSGPTREVFVTDSEQRARDTAIRSGSLIALPRKGRDHLVAVAELSRKALPGLALHHLIASTGWVLILLFFGVSFLTAESSSSSSSLLVVPAFFAALDLGMLLVLVRELGQTSVVLRAEERAREEEARTAEDAQ